MYNACLVETSWRGYLFGVEYCFLRRGRCTMSDTLLGILIGTGVSTVIGPIILAVFNRFFNRNKDGTELAQTALSIANQAVDDLSKARDEIEDLKKKVRILEDARHGPFRLTLKFDTLPVPVVLDTELVLVERENKS